MYLEVEVTVDENKHLIPGQTSDLSQVYNNASLNA